jgi:hypothetical protein
MRERNTLGNAWTMSAENTAFANPAWCAAFVTIDDPGWLPCRQKWTVI